MKNMLLAAAATAAFVAPAMGEVEYELGTGYSSQYNFRGVNFGGDLVETSLAASFEAGGYNLTVGAWYASFDDDQGFGLDDELDLYISAGKDVNILGLDGSIEVGFTQYLFQDASAANTNEVFIGLSTEYAGFDFGLFYVYDTDLIEESYGEATIGKSFELNNCVSADLEVGLAYSFDYYGSGDEISHYWAALAFPYAFRENAVLTPYVKYVQAEDATESIGQDDELLGGINLSVAF